MEPKKPLANSFLQKESYTSIFYICPHCKEINFKLFEESERFCHMCGGPIDWRVITQILGGLDSETMKEVRLDEKALVLVDQLNLLVGGEDIYRPSTIHADKFKELYLELKSRL